MSWMQYGKHPYEIGANTMPGVTVADIAHALSRINRFTGHTRHVISVARHSVFVSQLLEFRPMAAMYGLLHDVHETVSNDISFPFKRALSDTARKEIEILTDAADQALYEIFGVEWPMPLDVHDLVKEADNVATMTEKRDLMPDCARPWTMLKEKPCHLGADPTISPKDDEALFITRYYELAKHLEITPKIWSKT